MTWLHLVVAFLAALALWLVAEAFIYLGLGAIGG